MNVYNLPVGTKVIRTEDGVKGKIVKVHPPKDYHWRWYTALMDDGKTHYIKTWHIPKYFEIIED